MSGNSTCDAGLRSAVQESLPHSAPPAERFPSPLHLATYVAAAIFVAEAVVMVGLPRLGLGSVTATALVDASALSALVCPVLLWCLYRPVKRQAMERERMLDERSRMIAELREAMAAIRTLQGIVPICMFCKRIRTEDGAWQQVEVYVRDHSHADFSHGLCPECSEHAMRELKS